MNDITNSEKFWVIFWISFILAGLYGWVMNIISLIGATHFTGMVVARAIGIFVAPLGAVLGWF